ncbi:MAG TPA: tetratricopeptide repeat protein [Candidatus Sulfotelmatobacter sp.]|nr:tetratricopeptide repeat protein [Candidatus Sulfotelmatobacter sp.]
MSGCSRWVRPAIWPLAVVLAFSFLDAPPLFAGEPQWVEVRSPNFSVVTDAGEKRGREVAMRFEQMRAVFGSLMTKVNVSLPVPLQIVAFRNTKEMRQVAPLFNGKPTQVAGLFQSGQDRSFIMLDMSVENPWVVVFHEYAHQLMNGTIPEQLDPWFEEGFAEYFSSIEVDGKQARVGKVPEDEYLILRQSGTIKIADLFRVQQNSRTYNESGDHRTTFYAESGMLMHYIYDNQLMAQVGAYFDLKENKHLGSEDAIRQAFGMSAADFDKALRNYILSGHYRYYAIPTPANISSSKYPAVPLSAATGNAVLADIHLHSRDYQEQALKEFGEILKSDANNAAACRGLGYAYLQKQDFKNAQQYFKMASQLDSNDPRVHYYSALLMVRETGFGSDADLPGISRELETSISLDPNFADSYAVLALAQSTAGDSGKAIVTMRKALAISPRNENYVFNLANLYLANRQPDQAIPLLQVLRTANDPEVAARASASLAQVQQLRQMQQSATERGAGRLLLRTNQSEGDNSTRTENPGNEPLAKMPSASAPAKFLRGTLTNVDCSKSPRALLTVVSAAKTWKMSVADKNHLVLIGTDQFSCDWQKQKVALNYRETSEGKGNVISLELQ